MPTQTHRLLTRLQAETTPREMGAKSWNEVLRIRWRLSTGEASRRLHEAADLAARTSLVGQPLAPLLPAVAAAQSAGLITGEHVAAIRDAVKRLPSWVDTITAAQFEVDLVRVAVGVGTQRAARDRRRCGCSCSIRTAPNPTTPNANANATSPPPPRAATR